MKTTTSVGFNRICSLLRWVASLVVLWLLGSTIAVGSDEAPDDSEAGNYWGASCRFVEGYGTALSQLTQDLVRLMRQEKVMVVWLFDESESMRGNQKEIRDKLHKVYEELDLLAKTDKKIKRADDVLLTAVWGFGSDFKELTAKPTPRSDEVLEAIDRLGVESSGVENTCKAVSAALDQYGPMAQEQNRRLALVIVSDESGDDGELIEDAIDSAKKYQAPVYVLGREATFGYPNARMQWTDPKYKLNFWLQINRGPETAFPELLQTDGLHERLDSTFSGFGPYELMRLARETGGIHFILPGWEGPTTGTIGAAPSNKERRAELDAMKKYLPDLTSRKDYERERGSSKFRAAQWQVINVLNPHKDKELQIQETHFSTDPEKFDQQGAKAFQQAVRSLQLFNEALKTLDAVQPLREEEQSLRWRANYDLMHAQCQAYRVRLFQFLLALDQHKQERPPVANPMDNYWHIQRRPAMLPPDPVQVKLTKVDPEELNQQLEAAKKEFQEVIANHPHTPWARRAHVESLVGFGMAFNSAYHDDAAFSKAAKEKAAKELKIPKP